MVTWWRRGGCVGLAFGRFRHSEAEPRNHRRTKRADVLRKCCSLVELTGALTPCISQIRKATQAGGLSYLVEKRGIELHL